MRLQATGLGRKRTPSRSILELMRMDLCHRNGGLRDAYHHPLFKGGLAIYTTIDNLPPIGEAAYY